MFYRPRPFAEPRNPYFSGHIVMVLSFIELVLAMVLLTAQIGLYYNCEWSAVCLVVPSFIACLLFLITSIIGIATGAERTNGLILTLLLMSIITLVVTPINMGMWGLTAQDGGIPRKFGLVPYGDEVSAQLAIIYWGLLFIPVLEWILFVVTTSICSVTLCCPRPTHAPFPVGPAMHPGYAPSPVYGCAPPRKPVRPYPYY